MTSKIRAASVTMIDPHHETIRNVDVMAFHRNGTAHLDVTCCALLSTSTDGSNWGKDALVTARLRMDLSVVKTFAEGLLKQVAMIEGSQVAMN